MIQTNKYYNSGIYKLEYPSGKIYIGRSLNLNQRLNKYKNLLCKDQTYIYNAIKKYGWNKFKVTILYSEERINSTNDTLNNKEHYFIQEYNSLIPNGYNIRTGGEQPLISEESKLKMSKAHKNKKFTEEHKNKLKQVFNSKEVKERRSKSQKGKIISDYAKNKLRERTIKLIIQKDLLGNIIKIWDSIIDIQNTLGYKSQNISKACINHKNNLKNKAYGYLWEFNKNK